MKRTLAIFAISLICTTVGALAEPRLAVDMATYNYPDTVQGIAVAHTFVLSNVGDAELVITDVAVGCHCTTAQLPKDRLQPGESVGLYALLDTEGFSSRLVRTITITSNAPGPYSDYKFNLSFAGNVTARQPYQSPVSDLFYDSYLLLDVREPAAYAAGHFVGAMNVPASQAASFASGLPAGTLTIFYDQSGVSSTLTAVTQALHSGGVAEVYALRGGLNLWQRTYGEQRTAVGADTSWGSFVEVSGARAYSSSNAVQSYDITQLRSDYVLIDIRPGSSFAAGHIAGAVNLPETSISALVDGLPRETPVIVYSADGADSDRVVYSLWMRGSRVKSLLGGLAEWQKQHGNYLIVTSDG